MADSNAVNPNLGIVYRFNAVTGAYENIFSSDSSLSGPVGMAFGPNGDLYVPDGENGVDQYTGAGVFVQSFGWPSPVSGPSGIAIDAAGDVYVTDITNSIVVEFDSAGNYVATFNPGAG